MDAGSGVASATSVTEGVSGPDTGSGDAGGPGIGTGGTMGGSDTGETGGGLEPPEDCAWVVQAGVPANDWFDLAWIDEHRGFVVGPGGVALRTQDGGETWQPVDTGVSADFRTVSFAPPPDQDTGWIVGGIPVDSFMSGPTTVLRTTDGGLTWSPQNTSVFFPPTRVAAIDAQRGWIVWGLGDAHPDGHWNRTFDGGASWLGGAAPDFVRPLRALMDVTFPDGQSGWAVGANVVFKFTVDGMPSPSPINKVGGILHTADGGETWEVQETDAPAGHYFRGIHMLDTERGWVVGDTGSVHATADGGEVWTVQDSGTVQTLRDVYFASPTVGWAVGDAGTVIRTIDGGTTWIPMTSPITQTLRRIAASVSSAPPWVVGDGGVILRCL